MASSFIDIDGNLVPERWILFAREYLTNYRLGEAALKAGYTKKTASNTASRIVKDPKFKAVKAYVLREIEESMGLSKLTILDRLKEMAQANITDFLEIRKGKIMLKNNIESTDDLPDGIKRSIKAIKKNRSDIEIVMHDQMKALEMLTKLLGYQNNDQRVELQIQRSFKDFYTDIEKKK